MSRTATTPALVEAALPAYSQLQQEVPPAYKSTFVKTGRAGSKYEMTSRFTRALTRSWCKVKLEVNNTQLVMTSAGITGTSTRRYSLQCAQVGLACDYEKRPFSLRIRAESQQFLLAFTSLEECVEWLMALDTAINFSLPIEMRTLAPEPVMRGFHAEGADKSVSRSSEKGTAVDTTARPDLGNRTRQTVDMRGFPSLHFTAPWEEPMAQHSGELNG